MTVHDRPVSGPTVRWGILGTGKIARVIATALSESSAGSLATVGSRDGSRARAFVAEFGGGRAHVGYDKVIADPDVDLVYVATPHPHHLEWAVKAADAGKHVLCEKPMGVNHAEAAQIVDAARRNDVFLQEAFAYRRHPQTARLVDLIRSGAIGDLRLIDASFGYDAGPDPGNYLFDHDLAGGSLLDVGCYTTSMAHLLAAAGGAGDAPLQVAAAAFLGPEGVDHTTAATLVFGAGLVARLACSIRVNLDSSVRVYGSSGLITVSSPWLPGRIGSEARITVQRSGSEPEVIDIPLDAEVYTVEVDAVSRAVAAGERNPSLMTWEDSLANMRTLDRWRRAIGLRYRADDSAGSSRERQDLAMAQMEGGDGNRI